MKNSANIPLVTMYEIVYDASGVFVSIATCWKRPERVPTDCHVVETQMTKTMALAIGE